MDTVLSAFVDRGDAHYGESITQTQHALQAAQLAERSGAPAAMVGAALLHDYGHLVSTHPEDAADAGVDTEHERTGAAALAHWFPPEVTEPIRLHVVAKRYCCSRSPGYLEALSAASMQSLALQGGPLNSAEADAFKAEPFFHAALTLRGWDEAAKDPDAVTPALEHYRPLLLALTTQRAFGLP